MCRLPGPNASKQMKILQRETVRCEIQWEDELEGNGRRRKGTREHPNEESINQGPS